MGTRNGFNPENIDADENLSEEELNALNDGEGHEHRQGEATPEEKADRANKMKTQGRRGCKMPRVNLSTTPENYDFIHVLAKASGRSMTRTINDIIDLYREKNQDFYEKAKALVNDNKFWEGDKWET